MSRIEFPSTPINAVQQQEATPSPYSQLTLEGTADYEQSAEIELGYCIISTQPTYRKRKKGNEWHSTIHVQLDLLHPDQEGEYDQIVEIYTCHPIPGEYRTCLPVSQGCNLSSNQLLPDY